MRKALQQILIISKNKKALAILGILAAVLFAAVYFVFYTQGPQSGKQEVVTKNIGSGSEHIVELRENGFYPEELQIQKGDTVIFTATRGQPFWPASSLHPSHTIYPEFDPKEPIEPDKSWSFRFDKSGQWKYHDHLNASFLGVITVKEKAQDKNYTLDCQNPEDLDIQRKRACWRILLEDAFEGGGTSAALETLQNLYKTEPEYIVSGCHMKAHEIGDLAYGAYLKHKNLDLVDLPPEAHRFCGAGFYHGFLEHYLRDNPGTEFAKKFCEYLENRIPGIRRTCYHGMGHGMMPEPPDPSFWGDPQAILDPVLKQCDTISEDTVEVLECHEGAFNVLLNWMHIHQYGLTFDKKDPFGLCRSQTTREREYGCYYEFAMRVHGLAGNDIEKVAEMFINDIQDDYIASVAIGSAVATVIEAKLAKDDFVDFMLACRNLHERLRHSCTVNVAFGVIYHGEPGREYVKTLQLCGSRELSDTEKEVCYKRLSSYIPAYWPEKQKEICQSFEEQYQGLCQ